MKTDKRKTIRIDFPVKINYKLLPWGRGFYEALSENISGGGLGLQLNRPLTKGTRFKILLHFPGEKTPVIAVGEVVRCKKGLLKNKKVYNIGIKYLKVFPKDKQRFVFLFCELILNYFLEAEVNYQKAGKRANEAVEIGDLAGSNEPTKPSK